MLERSFHLTVGYLRQGRLHTRTRAQVLSSGKTNNEVIRFAVPVGLASAIRLLVENVKQYVDFYECQKVNSSSGGKQGGSFTGWGGSGDRGCRGFPCEWWDQSRKSVWGSWPWLEVLALPSVSGDLSSLVGAQSLLFRCILFHFSYFNTCIQVPLTPVSKQPP